MTAGRRLELGLLLAGAGAYWIALALLGTYTARLSLSISILRGCPWPSLFCG